MEQLDDEELLTKRNAKEYFDLCLNLVDKDELLEAITTLEKAISLQPSNGLYIEFSQYLKEIQSLSMEDSCKHTQTSINHESYRPLKETDKNVSPFNGPQKKRKCYEEKRAQNSPTGKCSHCSSNCNDKRNCSSEIPEKEETELFESIFDDIGKEEEEQDSSKNCEKPHWYPNPAKYNVEGFDIDARFLEEVCKQRESADGWDTYMKLLSDKSQDDDTSDESDDIDDLDVQNIGSINNHSAGNTNHSSEHIFPSKTTCEKNEHTKERDEENKSRVESSSSIGSSCEEIKSNKSSENNSSHTKVTKEASEGDEKERLYFMNGNGYYGIPPSPSDATTRANHPAKSKPSSNKPKMDPSENDFYQNLRLYFNVYDSKSDFLNRNKESVLKEAGSTNKPDGGERASSVKKEVKEDTQASGSNRSNLPHVDKEKHNTRSSSSRTNFDKQQSKDTTHTAEMPKGGHSSDRKGKKENKTTAASKDNSNSQQTRTKTKPNKKHKHKASESTRQSKEATGKEKTTRTTIKEEKIKKKTFNSSESDVAKEWSFLAVKKVVAALLWLLYYAILILLVVVIFTAQCLIAILKFLVGFIMSWRISIVVVNKLSHWTGMVLVWMIESYYSCKTKCIRWYYGIKTFGFKEFFFRTERPAQTYNLPNSGEDAIQQLLMKRDSDPYSILGVPKDASNDDIRKQYRKLAVLVHPDKNSHVHSAEAFRVLSGAYDVIGDPEKRQEFDTEVARREAFQQPKSHNPPRDFSDPREVFAEFLRQMEEIRESLSCDVCGSRHRRILTDRDIIHARRCYHCNRMHPAKEGDFWKESTYMGLGRSKFYACMEGRIYDISEWGHCQEQNGFSLPSDTHRVLGRISTKPRHPTPPTSRLEEELWRELFGHPDRYDGNHGNQGNRNRQQRSRRRKRR